MGATVTQAEILDGLSSTGDFDKFWNAYFALVDSGWRPRDNDLQFDVAREREQRGGQEENWEAL